MTRNQGPDIERLSKELDQKKKKKERSVFPISTETINYQKLSAVRKEYLLETYIKFYEMKT